MKIFFASDIHIGVLGDSVEGKELEQTFLTWLDMVKEQGETLYLLGDTFDFWFEYKNSIPKGYSSVLAKLRELTKSGVKVHFFHGNHDEWTREYLSEYVGMKIHTSEPETLQLQGKTLMVGHGHKLGLDHRLSARIIHTLFASKITYRFCEKFFHPDGFIAWGNKWSRGNMIKKRGKEPHIFNPENNNLLSYLDKIDTNVDYFVFGHFHTPVEYKINRKHPAQLVILGEWVSRPHYAVMENGEITLHSLKHE